MYRIQEEVEAKYSRKSIRAKVMEDIDTDHSAFLSMTQAIDKYRAGSYYDSKVGRIGQLAHISSHDIAVEIFIVILPINEISPIQAVCTQLGTHLGIPKLLDAVKTAAELLAVCEYSGVYEIYHSTDYNNDTGTMGIRSKYSLEPHTQAFINQTKYLPPMICKPMGWAGNTNGGHLHGSSSLLLGHLNHHDDTQSLVSINILQEIPWSLNSMVDYVENTTKELNTHQKRAQFEDMRTKSTEVYDDLVKQGNKFYFVWKYDKRGRMYSQGYHCNLQGTAYKKAILNFAKEELIK